MQKQTKSIHLHAETFIWSERGRIVLLEVGEVHCEVWDERAEGEVHHGGAVRARHGRVHHGAATPAVARTHRHHHHAVVARRQVAHKLCVAQRRGIEAPLHQHPLFACRCCCCRCSFFCHPHTPPLQHTPSLFTQAHKHTKESCSLVEKRRKTQKERRKKEKKQAIQNC